MAFVIILKIQFLIAVVCFGDKPLYFGIGEGVQLISIDVDAIHSHSYAYLVTILHLQGIKTSYHVQRGLHVDLSRTDYRNHSEPTYLLPHHLLVVSQPTVAQRVYPGLIL